MCTKAFGKAVVKFNKKFFKQNLILYLEKNKNIIKK